MAYVSNDRPSEKVFGAWRALEKRGPDSFGSWSDNKINLYHTRLSILDLSSTGNQPIESTRWIIVYNGEAYNHMDMRKCLGPMHWESHCDTITVLNCIEQKGIEWTLNNIEGMFALAAYDKFDKKIYMAVDPYSIKPLYYYKTAKFFACASSSAALSHLRDKWELDKFAMIDMLALGGTKVPLFLGMKRIRGGEMVIYDIIKETVRTTQWYTRKERICNEKDLIEAVKHSIQITKISDVPSFIFLSGGIDSTIIASQCHHMNAVHLKSPEEEYAKKAADKYKNNLHFIEPRNYSARECLEDYARQSGDCSMAALQPYIVSKEASKFGKVAISANGADELCFGYNRMNENVTLEQWQHIFRAGLDHSWGDYMDYKTTRELELETYVQYDLNKTLDFSSMCHSLEVRVPYLNKTVVEMALSIPRMQHVNGYGNKSILKKFLLSEGFSKEFITRPKVGFSLHTQPSDYSRLKVDGLKLLREKFDIKNHFYSQRDSRYFESSAAAFLCWFNIWESKLLL